MRPCLIVSIILLFFSKVQAQQYAWLHHFTSGTDVAVTRLASDRENNVYTMVNFDKDVTIQGQTFSDGALLVKLNSNGDLIWTKRFTYSNKLFTGLSGVETDAQNNVYVHGQFPESATIDGMVVTGGAHNSFIAKFSSAGDLMWVRTLYNVQEIFKMSVNDAGDVAITGRHYISFTIGNVALSMLGYNSFGALLDTDGNTQWAKVFGSGFNEETNQPISLAIDEAGNYFFCGRYNGQVKIDSKEVAPNAQGIFNMYFIKINRQGVCEWLVDGLRSSSLWGQQNIWEWGDLDTDADGNLYGCGSFWSDVKIGSFQLNASAPFMENFYTFKIDPQGNVLWVKPIYHLYSANHIENIIAKDDKLHASGILGTVPFYQTFDATTGDPLTTMTFSDIHADIAGGLAIDEDDQVYLSGRNYIANGIRNGFVLKLKGDSSIPTPNLVTAPAAICHGDKIVASIAPLSQATWYDWEFTYSNGTVAVFTTTSPDIEVSTSVIGAAAVEVRVRGRNADVTGQYSPVAEVGIRSAPEPSVIEVVCNDVRVVHGNAGSWYKDGQKLSEIPDGENFVTGIDKGEYYVMSDNGCGIAVSNKVVFEPVVIPNIVTPNGDKKNDTFIVDERLPESNLRIINRWGEQVFTSHAYKNDWSGDTLPAGVYFYTLHSGCLNDVIKGSVTIAR